MNQFLQGQVVNVTIPLVDENATAIVASAASYRVLDEDGDSIVAATSISPWVGSEVEAAVSVSALNNTLGVGVPRGLRTVELTLTTAGGTVVLQQSYVIEVLEPLTIPVNSAQNLASAELKAVEFPNLASWNGATRNQKIAALTQAFAGLVRMSYKFAYPDFQRYMEPFMAIDRLDELSLSEWNALDETFKNAIKRAQVIEADYLLRSDDDLEKMRESGLIARKVGESEDKYRETSPTKGFVCDAALREVSRYIDTKKRIGRA